MYYKLRFILAVYFLVCNINKRAFGDVDFAFEEEVYAHVIKSTQKTLKPIFHIKAPHCRYGPVSYSLYNKFGPFQINPRNGSVFLAYSLDPNGPNRYVFNVQAVDANALCHASAEIQIYIVHINKHKPIMSAAKYNCKVFENEHTVKVTPPIYATDKDEGPSGIIKAIHIREQGIPFQIEMQNDGKANLVLQSDLDAEIMNEYYFTIYAVDNGTRARKSERSKVYCEVGDVNEFPPIFKHQNYYVTIQRGQTYENIIQLEAVDRDISTKMGKVCNYAIVESSVPFDINKTGMLSLKNPFLDDDPVEFHVKAVDCGGVESDEHAVVKVTVKDASINTTVVSVASQLKVPGCSQAMVLKSENSLKYPPCTENLQLLPHAEINYNCGNDNKEHDFSVTAHLDSSLVRKGCERSRENILSLYKQCGAPDVTDMLPTSNNGWVEDLIKEETIQGETNYIFDGNSATRLPKKVVGLNWESKFTIAAWLLVKAAPRPQFMLSWSDGMQFGNTYIGLYVISKGDSSQPRIGFIMNKDKGKCRFNEEWGFDEMELKWRHFAVIVDGCNLQMLIDGDPVEPVGVKEVLKPEQTHIQPKYVIGGRWLGTYQKYTDFFNGKISQMVFSRSRVKDFRCILQCKESLDFSSPIVNGFQVESSFKEQTVYLTGRGSIPSLQKMLRKLVYSNVEPYPTAGNRIVCVETQIDKTNLPVVNVEIDAKKAAGPDILLTGKCDNSMKTADLSGQGFPICEDIQIEVNGCLRTLEEAVITIDSDVVSPNNLSVSTSLLKRFDLQSAISTNGLRINGLAKYSDYTKVLKSLRFKPRLEIIQSTFDIKMEVSAQNGRFTSNALVVEIDTKKDGAANPAENDSFFFFKTKAGSSTGSLSHGRLKTEKNKSNKSIFVFAIVAGFAIVSIVVGAATVRYIRKSRENDAVEIDLKSTELLWDDEGLGSINITMNPLIRFRPESMLSEEDNTVNSYEADTVISYEGESSEASLYWSESDDDNDSDDPDVKNALEWDSLYQEDFSEVFHEDVNIDKQAISCDESNEDGSIPRQESPCTFQKTEESQVWTSFACMLSEI